MVNQGLGSIIVFQHPQTSCNRICQFPPLVRFVLSNIIQEIVQWNQKAKTIIKCFQTIHRQTQKQKEKENWKRVKCPILLQIQIQILGASTDSVRSKTSCKFQSGLPIFITKSNPSSTRFNYAKFHQAPSKSKYIQLETPVMHLKHLIGQHMPNS